MKRLQRLLEIQYDALHFKEWDAVTILVGDEGTGKSNLLLGIADWWFTKKYGVCLEEHIKYINLDISKWADSFSDCGKGDFNALDEAGDISSRRAMSNLNLAINRAYQIIRADNINSYLCLPDLFWLDGAFTKRRAKGLIYVYKRGSFGYWDRDRLRKIIDLNANRVIKSIWVVKPNFKDHFPIYKGVLKVAYDRIKKDYMKDTRKELAETIRKIKGKETSETSDSKIGLIPKDVKLTLKYYENFGIARAVKDLDIPKQTIYDWIKRYKKDDNSTIT